jgi:hypothetical protein
MKKAAIKELSIPNPRGVYGVTQTKMKKFTVMLNNNLYAFKNKSAARRVDYY